MYQIDDIDREILMILQRGIPLSSRPYLEMAEEIGKIGEMEVIERIDRLKKENIIRRMSGFFNSPKLGYVSTLVCVKPREGCFDEAVKVINAYPGITHNYERDHEFAIWFTLIAINRPTMDHILETIAGDQSIAELIPLNMKKRYKIDVTFDLRKGAKGHA